MPVVELTVPAACAVPTPVEIPILVGSALPPGPLELHEMGGNRVFTAQSDGSRLVTVITGVAPGPPHRFRIERGAVGPGVNLANAGARALSIRLPEGLFLTYQFDSDIARPFFHPVLGPGGKAVTRAFPMKREVPGEARDHPHHRSFWTAYGEVNGVDDWSEARGHGWIRHGRFSERQQGPVFGGFTATAVWTAHEGEPLLDETRSIRIYNVGPERRLFDYEVHLTAAYSDVFYGDTKEGGILSFRVATTMDGNKGGRMENAEGGVGEKECWGKPSAWLDYSGPVGDETFGIGMMDHPGNLRHPCYWHARDYGLVGTNPFARAAFEAGEETGYRQAQGETLRFRYRVLIHRGNAAEGGVAEAYQAWVRPPQARLRA
jgi:hypothetical protein